MRFGCILFVFWSAILSLQARHLDAAESALRVMTFNIRYGSAPDGDNAWPHRKELVLDTIRKFEPDILGVQEALRMQLDVLAEALPQYVSLGVGRDSDGGGEYSSVLFRRSRFDVLAAGTFWLSDTPERPGSTSWGNELPRICSWSRFFDRETGDRFYVFNTHWDHRSQPSREQAGRLMADRVANRASSAEPVVVMGDFNAGESNAALGNLKTSGVQDSYRLLHPDAKTVGTFNGFNGRTDGKKIDAIFVSSHWQVREAAIDRTERDGRTPSDHFPVTAVLSRTEP